MDVELCLSSDWRDCIDDKDNKVESLHELPNSEGDNIGFVALMKRVDTV